MFISFKKLDKAGYDVHPNGKNGIDIVARNPIVIDWDAMQEQFADIGLGQFEIDAGLDAFHTEVEMHQVMKAIRG